MQTYYVINFYKFVELNNLERLAAEHRNVCEKLGFLGSVVVSPEGVNVALSSTTPANLEDYLNYVRTDARFADLSIHRSEGKTKPFGHFSVRVKRHILIFDTELKPSVTEIRSGARLSAEEFEQLVLNKPDDVIILDTRNYYEIDYGKFPNAESLDISKFRDFPNAFLERYKDQKDKKFLMYCTGGIRCEKAVAFAKKAGFENCFQLEGGIIRYHATRGSGAFEGNNFVFDQRWALTPQLGQSDDGPHPDRI